MLKYHDGKRVVGLDLKMIYLNDFVVINDNIELIFDLNLDDEIIVNDSNVEEYRVCENWGTISNYFLIKGNRYYYTDNNGEIHKH